MAWTNSQHDGPFLTKIGQWRVATDIFYNSPVMWKYGFYSDVSLDKLLNKQCQVEALLHPRDLITWNAFYNKLYVPYVL